MSKLSDLLLDQNAKLSKESDFYLEFGKFICGFASAETAIHTVFRKVTGLVDRKARAIVGGARLVDLISIVQRLAAFSDVGEAEKKELAALFSQIQAIANFRHALVHRGAEVSETEIVSDNLMTAKTWESIESMSFQLSDIQAATSDLSKITIRLYALFDEKILKDEPHDFLVRLFAPWSYKPVLPKRPGLPTQSKNQKPSRPRKPSPA